MGHAAASRAKLNEAIELINAGERGKAEAICRDAVQRNPDDINMTALLGATLLKAGEMDEAEKFLPEDNPIQITIDIIQNDVKQPPITVAVSLVWGLSDVNRDGTDVCAVLRTTSIQ